MKMYQKQKPELLKGENARAEERERDRVRERRDKKRREFLKASEIGEWRGERE